MPIWSNGPATTLQRTPSGPVQLFVLQVRKRGLVAVAALPQVLLPQLPARNLAVLNPDPSLGLGRGGGNLLAVLFFLGIFVIQTLKAYFGQLATL